MTEIKRSKKNAKAEEEFLQAVREYNTLLAEYFLACPPKRSPVVMLDWN